MTFSVIDLWWLLDKYGLEVQMSTKYNESLFFWNNYALTFARKHIKIKFINHIIFILIFLQCIYNIYTSQENQKCYFYFCH